MGNEVKSGKRTCVLTEEAVERYFSITSDALDKLSISPPHPSHLLKIAEDFLSMARNYYDDAGHFMEKGDLKNAFACLNYAHGWMDAGMDERMDGIDGSR